MFATSQQGTIDATLPGSGLITPDHHKDWQKIISLVPENVASDPSVKFCNPTLVKPLLQQLEQLVGKEGGERVSSETYEKTMVEGLTGEKVKNFLISMRNELAVREDNPYHGDYHSLLEVPQRVLTILKNLKDGVL